jgi:hypothetical protein
MVSFNKSLDDELKYVKDLTLFRNRYILLILCIVLPIDVILISIFKKTNYNFFQISLSILIVIFILLLFIYAQYLRSRKNIKDYYYKNFELELQIYSIDYINNSYVITNKINDGKISIKDKDIVKIYKFFSILIIKTIDKNLYYLPNNVEIRKLFSSYLIKQR